MEKTVREMIVPQLEALQEFEATHSEEEVETYKREQRAANDAARAKQDAVRKQLNDALGEQRNTD